MTIQEHQHNLTEAISNKTILGGAATGIVGWLTSINWIGLVGTLVAVIGLLANIYYQHRRDKREQIESAARIAALRAGTGKIWNE